VLPDSRFGVVVGLKAKGKARHDESGFVVRNNADAATRESV